MNRRQFLGTSLAATGALVAPRRAHATTAGDRKFIFVYNLGGWDPTRVFAPEFDNAGVDMESTAAAATAGGLVYVDHPNRPSVRSFLAANHARTAIFNGVLVRAISHDLCRRIALTGSTSGFAPDWPSVIAAAAADRYVLPHLVVAGPSYPGDNGAFVARTGLNGQLDGLLSGDITDVADIPTPGPGRSASARLDAWVAARASARRAAGLTGPDLDLAAAFETGTSRSQALQALQEEMSFDAGEDLPDQSALAVRALSIGLSRCVSLAWPAGGRAGTWDSHTDNDVTQSALFEELFQGLSDLWTRLQATDGSNGRLSEETTVVVWSEMGRTPGLNESAGKDHWPYTSVMMFGAGVAGDRTIGAFDTTYSGEHVDPATGEVTDGGEPLSAEMLGATLLAAADLDPAEQLPGQSALTGVLT